ncbi:MAG: hypothetical protein ACREYE_30975 [Gammaproteobacteria bacterium]
MSETIAITGKSVKLFKGHYTRSCGARDPQVFQYTLRLLVSSLRLAPAGLARRFAPGETLLRSGGTRPPFARDDFFTISQRRRTPAQDGERLAWTGLGEEGEFPSRASLTPPVEVGWRCKKFGLSGVGRSRPCTQHNAGFSLLGRPASSGHRADATYLSLGVTPEKT